MKAAEDIVWRSVVYMRRGTWLYRWRNNDIRGATRLTKVSKKITWNRMKCEEKHRVFRVYILYNRTSRKKRGRPKTRWRKALRRRDMVGLHELTTGRHGGWKLTAMSTTTYIVSPFSSVLVACPYDGISQKRRKHWRRPKCGRTDGKGDALTRLSCDMA